MALSASISGWEYCKPMIVIDDMYLNGHHGGTLYIGCTQGANNSIFVLAFRIGNNENDRS